MRGTKLPCNPKIRAHNCCEFYQPRDYFSNMRIEDGKKLFSRICIGCPILRLDIEGKAQEDIANLLGMDAHTVGEFQVAIQSRIQGWGWESRPYIDTEGKIRNAKLLEAADE